MAAAPPHTGDRTRTAAHWCSHLDRCSKRHSLARSPQSYNGRTASVASTVAWVSKPSAAEARSRPVQQHRVPERTLSHIVGERDSFYGRAVNGWEVSRWGMERAAGCVVHDMNKSVNNDISNQSMMASAEQLPKLPQTPQLQWLSKQ